MLLSGAVRPAAYRFNTWPGPGCWPDGSFLARRCTHTPGHFRSSKLPEDRIDNDRFPSTAGIGPEPLQSDHPPKRSITILLP